MPKPTPDWEAFSREIMTYWPECDVDGGDLQRAAIKHNIILSVEGGFNPKIHQDHFGCAEPGDEWFMTNYEVNQ